MISVNPKASADKNPRNPRYPLSRFDTVLYVQYNNLIQVASDVRRTKSQPPISVGWASCPTSKVPVGRQVLKQKGRKSERC